MNKPDPDRQTRERHGDKQRKHRRVSVVPHSVSSRVITETTRAACLADILDDAWRVVAVREPVISHCHHADRWRYSIVPHEIKKFREAVQADDIICVHGREPSGFVLFAKLAARR